MRCPLVQMLRYDVCKRTDNTGGAIRWIPVMHSDSIPSSPRTASSSVPFDEGEKREITAHRGAFFPYSSVQSLCVTVCES